MTLRFKAIEGSQLGHGCCFRATVVDTTKPVMIAGKHYENEYEVVCETFELAEAERIAEALNRAANSGEGRM